MRHVSNRSHFWAQQPTAPSFYIEGTEDSYILSRLRHWREKEKQRARKETLEITTKMVLANSVYGKMGTVGNSDVVTVTPTKR